MGENLAATCADLAWHCLPSSQIPTADKAKDFETEALRQIGLLDSQIPPRYHTSYFNHVWGGGYAAGYYSYLWSEVLAANCAEYFTAHGALNPAVGQAFRTKVLSRGNTDDLMKMFTDFTGMQSPDASALLKSRGMYKGHIVTQHKASAGRHHKASRHLSHLPNGMLPRLDTVLPYTASYSPNRSLQHRLSPFRPGSPSPGLSWRVTRGTLQASVRLCDNKKRMSHQSYGGTFFLLCRDYFSASGASSIRSMNWSSFGMMMICVRRLRCLPISVPLVATGLYSPRPPAVRRFGSTP